MGHAISKTGSVYSSVVQLLRETMSTADTLAHAAPGAPRKIEASLKALWEAPDVDIALASAALKKISAELDRILLVDDLDEVDASIRRMTAANDGARPRRTAQLPDSGEADDVLKRALRAAQRSA